MVLIRSAVKSDAQTIVELIKGLAEYEKLADEVEVTASRIEQTLFGDSPRAFALIAEVDGETAGFMLYFFNYSTFLGKHGIYLEDFYVKPEYRSQKVGFELFKALAKVAIANDCGRIDWSVLDWNQLAIDFYQRLKANEQTEWLGYRLEEPQIRSLSQL